MAGHKPWALIRRPSRPLRVEVEPDGRFWLVSIPEVKVVTQARHIGEIEPMARDAVATRYDVAPDSFGLQLPSTKSLQQ